MTPASIGQIVYLTLGAIAVALYVRPGLVAMRSLQRRGALAAAAIAFSMAGWIMSILMLNVSGPGSAETWDYVRRIFTAIVPWLAFWGAMEVAGLRPRGLRWLQVATAVPLVARLALVWPLAEYAHLIDSMRYQAEGLLTYSVRIAYGPLYVPFVAYCYGLMLAAIGVFGYFMMTSGRLARSQGLAVAAGFCCGLLAHAINLPGSEHGTTYRMVVALVLSGAFFHVAIIRLRVLELTPVSRHRLFDSIGMGVVVVDRGGHVVDLNPAMATLCGVTLAAALGRRFVELLAPGGDLRRRMVAGPGGIVLARGDQQYAVQAVRLLDARGNLEGHVYLFQDETERRRAEGDREQLIAQLREATLLAETTRPSPSAALHSAHPSGSQSV
jgi:PAS domain-containing protein